MTKVRKALLAGALIVPLGALGASLATGALRRPPAPEKSFRSGIFDPPRVAPNFTLDGSDGAKVSLRDQHDKVVILGFGYTYCPYVCPTTLARLNDVYRKLGDAAGGVQLIYVTVDPARDTPARLRQYLATFNPSFLGASGTSAELDAVLKSFGVVADQVIARNQEAGYAVDHASFLYLVDKQGRLRGLVPFGASADDIVHDLELLLKT